MLLSVVSNRSDAGRAGRPHDPADRLGRMTLASAGQGTLLAAVLAAAFLLTDAAPALPACSHAHATTRAWGTR